ncbi:hypothetical protein LNQ52_10285 [Klebsiella pneumoniae subsp. pneumoniae]|nr:hypothetical protein [Klebsiella pneumoniae subsp. pneumoniae]
MITYLLPLLIGYTGGKLVGGERGGVVGAITTMGVIVGADMPMFLGSMIAGPLGGYCIKKFDNWVDGKIKSGFEMLVNNFSAGIIRDDPRHSGLPRHRPGGRSSVENSGGWR